MNSNKNNPYAPPTSKVSDFVPVTREPKPRQVFFAVKLLWISLALSLPSLVLSTLREADSLVAMVAIVAVQLVLYAFVAYLNMCVSRGKNWARIVSLLLVLLALGMLAFMPAVAGTTMLEEIASGLSTLLDVVAMYLLFTKPGSLWFRTQKDQPV